MPCHIKQCVTVYIYSIINRKCLQTCVMEALTSASMSMTLKTTEMHRTDLYLTFELRLSFSQFLVNCVGVLKQFKIVNGNCWFLGRQLSMVCRKCSPKHLRTPLRVVGTWSDPLGLMATAKCTQRQRYLKARQNLVSDLQPYYNYDNLN